MWGNTATKQKPYERNTIVIHNVFFLKTTKLNSQSVQYFKILAKIILKKHKNKKIKKTKKRRSEFWIKKEKNVRKKMGKISKKKKSWRKLTFIKHITMTWYRTNLHFSTSVIDII